MKMESVNCKLLLHTIWIRYKLFVFAILAISGVSISFIHSVHASELDRRIEEEIYSFHKMTLSLHPMRPPQAVPRFLIPEGAVLLYSTDLKSNFYTTLEAFLVMDLPQPKHKADQFYTEALQNREWKLLQSDYRENVSLYLSEGFSRKILTVTIEKTGDSSSRIRISFRKNSSF